MNVKQIMPAVLLLVALLAAAGTVLAAQADDNEPNVELSGATETNPREMSELLAASIHGSPDVDIAVPNGTYTLQLLLYEGWRSRSADIVIEGKTVREKYDQLKEQGGTFRHGSVLRHTFTLADGNVDIEIKANRVLDIHLGGLILSKGKGDSTVSATIVKSIADLDLKDVIKAINFGDTTNLNVGDVKFAAAAVNTTVDGVTNTARGDVHAGEFQQKLPFVAQTKPVASSEERFAVADGLAAEIFATEQQFFNPSSIDVDDKGRVWVCETVNYRKNTRKEGDRILVLDDTNGDGKADSQTVFYEGHDIDGGHGVCVLGNQAIVSVSDKILLLTDQDGDDRADNKKLLFTGKVLNPKQGQHDHAIHAVMFGPDGRLYFNFGNLNAHLRDGEGKPVRDIEGRAVDNRRKPYQQGMVIRCELDGSNVEVLGHNFRNNWEVTVDSFGSMWQSDNDNGSSSCRVNFVMEYGNYGYNDEITGAGYQSHRTNLESTMQRQMWHQNDPGVVPNLLITGAGAPTGILVYEGDLLPSRFHGQMLLAEPGRNVVWTIPVKKNGAGYSAEKANLLTTPGSQIFRPSDISVAPDGSLIVADWFDPIVCCHATQDDRGRLFRVAPPGHEYQVPKLDYSTPKGAVAALRNPNLSVRYKAWSALNQMQEEASAALESLADDVDPRMRARAMWLLAAIKGNAKPTVQLASTDKSDDSRALALRIARRHRLDPIPLVRQLVRDPSALVRRECALSLRRSSSAEAPQLWAELAMQHDGLDRWYLEALGIGEQGNEAACFTAWLKLAGDDWRKPAGRDIVWRSRAPQAAGFLTKLILDPDVPTAEHPRMMRAFDFHQGEARVVALREIVSSESNSHAPTAMLEAVKRLPDEAVTGNPVLHKRFVETLRRTDNKTMIQFARRFQLKSLSDRLLQVATSEGSGGENIEAVKLLLEFGEEERVVTAAAESVTLIDALGFAGTSKSIYTLKQIILRDVSRQRRTSAVTALAGNPNGERTLRQLIAQKRLTAELEAAASHLLYRSTNPQLRKFAADHLGLPEPSEKDALRSLAKLLAKKPDPQNGPEVFTKATCSKCHKVDGQGVEFGPDLSAIGSTMTRRELLVSILAPSATIMFGYENFTVFTANGKVINGYRTGETDTTLSLRTTGGIQHDIFKANLDDFVQSKVSLMPLGLEKPLTDQEIADLVAWLKTRKSAGAKSEKQP